MDFRKKFNIGLTVETNLKEFEKQNNGATLEEYIQAVTLINDIDSYEEEDDSVVIATIHAVKGLEFKNVYIIGLEEGIFPLIRSVTAICAFAYALPEIFAKPA